MLKTGKATGRSMSVPEGMALSGIVSLGITLAVAVILARLLDSQKLDWEQAGYWIMGMLFAAAFAGGKTALTVIRRQKLAVTLMSGCLYWGVLLCITALFFGGSYEAVPETALLIIAGSGCAAIVSRSPRKSGRKRIRKQKL